MAKMQRTREIPVAVVATSIADPPTSRIRSYSRTARCRLPAPAHSSRRGVSVFRRGVGSGLVGLIVVFGLAACGAGETVSPQSPSPSLSESVLLRQETLQQYFNPLSRGTVNGAELASASASPGSPAAAFAEHQANMIVAARSSQLGQVWTVSTTVVSDSSVDWTAGSNQYSDTAEFTDFEYDRSGRLTTWLVSGKYPLTTLVGRVNKTQSIGGTEITVKDAYRTATGDLQVTYEAAAQGKSGNILVDGYVNKGRTRKGSPQAYQLDLSRRATAEGASVFLKSDWGGDLVFSSFYPNEGQAEIPVTARPFTDSASKQKKGDET